MEELKQFLQALREYTEATTDAIVRAECAKDVAWKDLQDKQDKLNEAIEKVASVL